MKDIQRECTRSGMNVDFKDFFQILMISEVKVFFRKFFFCILLL